MAPRRKGAASKAASGKSSSNTRPKKRHCEEASDDDDDEAEETQEIAEVEESNDDDDDDDDCCLHCQTESTEVQVRCDECCAYICNDCHWCHEFQANHEIRVCDRCDAFYCRSCDEMDQCDDCAEVVCGSCSTLLSCKFCGGGLCEECATACGRCGIVLCSRDAKFAVDCDTCRLSYCLVCLASGSKDPCVRCGHRPSKRMEQLVHLRLKSIYKAFKQNSSSTAKSSNTRERQNDDPDEDLVADDPEALLHAAASAAKNSAKHGRNNKSKQHGGSDPQSADERSVSTQDHVKRYNQEKEKADAAAAALLAELEEEEEAVKTKQSKKNKKKKARQAAKMKDKKGDVKPAPAAAVVAENDDDTDDDDDDEDSSLNNYWDVSRRGSASATSVASSSSLKDPPSSPEKKEENPDDDAEGKVDPLEQELCDLVAAEDTEGLEKLLASIKGVPGRAVLRKNTKKALKRIRLAASNREAEEQEEEENMAETRSASGGATSPEEQPPPIVLDEAATGGLLKIVSLLHNKPSAQPGTARKITPGVSRSECILHMAPVIVGWVIGKGGQRIRDLMEESGARIWIDQDSMGPQEPRIVYVSGQRKSVDSAVGMIQDLVCKAPTASPHSRQTTPLVDGSAAYATGSGRAPQMPDAADVAGGGGEVSLKPKSGTDGAPRTASRGAADGRTKHVMSCEPRFVPLLIGRRGWTIKNIQDSCGAKVDIDQSVNPRKITISGCEENVEKAIRMVGDVLSYPHAQLQGEEGEAHTNSNVARASPTQAKVSPPVPEPSPASPVPLAAIVAKTVAPSEAPAPKPVPEVSENKPPTPPSPPQQQPTSPVNSSGNRVRVHSPPSSLIMTGDAKSTISASSSLSSTPEPSMASATRPAYIPTAPGPMLSPSQNQDLIVGGGSGTPQNAFNRSSPAQVAVGGPPIFPGNGNSMHGQGDQFFGGLPQPRLSSNQIGHSIPPPQQANNVAQDPGTFHPSNQVEFGAMHGLQGSMSMPPQNSFQAPSQGQFPNQNLQSDTQPGMLNRFGNDAGGPTLWDRPGLPPSQTNGPDGFRLDAAVDFLEHSKHPAPVHPVGGGVVNQAIGLVSPSSTQRNAIVVPQGSLAAAPVPLLNSQGRDDAQMVDSLFGPADNTAAVGSSLLTGLQGLSINNNKDSSTDLWGASSSPRSSGLNGLPSLGGLAPESDNPLLFPVANPSLATTEQKTQSRFAWGESSGGG